MRIVCDLRLLLRAAAGALFIVWLVNAVHIAVDLDAVSMLMRSQESDDVRIIQSPDEFVCVPRTVDASAIEYRSSHAFYTELQQTQLTIPTPEFVGHHRHLCDASSQPWLHWSYCLPTLLGRTDDAPCHRADRMALLKPQTSCTLCSASVLHMLLIDVYDELKAMGWKPALLYGTLLGAVRNGSLIPFTEDVDLGFQPQPEHSVSTMRQALAAKGYHLFRDTVLRVCVAPTHPLAAHIYDPTGDAYTEFSVPYVDLYRMTPDHFSPLWNVEEAKNDRMIWPQKIEPYSHVTLNDMEFDTVADPIDFLLEEYGADYLTPKRRQSLLGDVPCVINESDQGSDREQLRVQMRLE